MSTIPLTPVDLALAAALLIVNGAISIAFGLRLERSLTIAAIRMVVQLAVVGYVLKFVFAQTSPAWTALVALVMVLAAGIELMQRQERRPRGWLAYGLGNATLLLAGGLTALYAAAIVIGPSPWYAPRYVLPILEDPAVLRDASKVMRSASESYVRVASDALIANFDKPVLFAWPEEDPVFPLDHARNYAKALRNARVVLIGDTFGFAAEDQPEQLAKIIAEFAASDLSRGS